MANKQDIEETYEYMDVIFRSTMGENGDITCALYNGDFSKSLEQAQKDKHVYIRYWSQTGFPQREKERYWRSPDGQFARHT